MEMKKNMIRKENWEKIPYTFPDLPLYARREWLSSYPNKTGIAHLHKDVEFLVILQGELLYSVNGSDYLLRQGEGIFVNSKNLHYGYSYYGRDCEFICIIFPLSLFGSSAAILGKYANPILNNQDLSCLRIKEETPLSRSMLHCLKEIYRISSSQEPEYELTAVSLFLDIWKNLYRYIKSTKYTIKPFDQKHIQELRNMIEFIQNHFSEKITLEQIAAAGNVCRSNCCKIFQEFLNKTPIAYLMDYRIYKSMELLANASMTITEVAYQCGFSNASYFIKVFRRSMGETPVQYKETQGLIKISNKYNKITNPF